MKKYTEEELKDAKEYFKALISNSDITGGLEAEKVVELAFKCVKLFNKEAKKITK